MAEPPAIQVHHDHPAYPLDAEVLVRLLATMIAAEGYQPGEVSIVLTDHATVRALNRTYLNHDYDTDVISFSLAPLAPDIPLEGEVYVDLDTAAERHAEFGTSFQEEAFRYVLHGTLHLLGYDDATPADKAKMRALENRYLSI